MRPCRDARAYVGFARLFRLLCTDAILEMFGPQQPREHYRELVGEETDAETRAPYAEWQGAPWGQTRRV